MNLSQQILYGNLRIFKNDLASRGAFDAHFALFRAGGNARPAGLDDESGGTLIAETREDDEDIGEARVGNPLLRTIQDVVFAVRGEFGAGGQAHCIGTNTRLG